MYARFEKDKIVLEINADVQYVNTVTGGGHTHNYAANTVCIAPAKKEAWIDKAALLEWLKN